MPVRFLETTLKKIIIYIGFSYDFGYKCTL